MKQLLFTDWHLMRWIRLALGLIFVVYSLRMQDSLSGFMAVLFLFQAVFNTGCCGSRSCSMPQTGTNTVQSKEIEFEEIK